jgi:AFG3 family protein
MSQCSQIIRLPQLALVDSEATAVFTSNKRMASKYRFMMGPLIQPSSRAFMGSGLRQHRSLRSIHQSFHHHDCRPLSAMSAYKSHTRLFPLVLKRNALLQTSIGYSYIGSVDGNARLNVIRSLVASSFDPPESQRGRLNLPETMAAVECAVHRQDIRQPEPGTGFDNFLPPKRRRPVDPPKAAPENEHDEEEEDPKEKEGKNRKQSQGDGGGGGSSDNSSLWFSLAIAAFIVLDLVQRYYEQQKNEKQTLTRKKETDGSTEQDMSFGSSAVTSNVPAGSALSTITSSQQQKLQRDITWHDFLRLLQQRDIQKVVVTGSGGNGSNSGNGSSNNITAYVYLTPNAVGLSGPYQRTASNVMGMDDHQYNADINASQQHQLDGLEHWPAASSSAPLGSSLDSSGMMISSPQNLSSLRSYRLQIGSLESFERKLDEAQRALGRSEREDVPVQYTDDSNTLAREVLGIVPGLLLAGAMFLLMRFASRGAMGAGMGGRGGGGPGNIFSIGKSTAQKISKEDVKINFSDVAGCDEAKKEIMEFVDFLKDSERFTKLGAKIPKGALLCGPPGTGKTLLAKAVAGEAGVPFYSISGSDFIEMFVGVGPSRVRDLFAEARANAPCIVFIDEIDAVGRQRGRGGMGGNDERENTLNQLLVEMDGFAPTTGVVVLAGTNRVDILDQALTRPGRFDRQITVDKPDLKGRKEIFKVHLKGITLEDSIEDVASRLAGLTPGFAGADIANICNEAAIVAARRKGETVTMNDFEKATDRIIGGLESNKIMSKEERSIVAHHEAGHAVAGWFLEHADALLKVTIIPRTSGALGFAQYLPKEVFLRTQDQIMDIVCMALAGRAAEEIFFGSVTTGASDDLKRVTQLVYSTIQLYGMNSRLGQLSFPKDPNAMFEDRPYSEKTAKVMDEEARAIVDAAYERTLNLLRSKKKDVAKVAQLLLDRETITHDDIAELIGERPYKGDSAYEEFIRRRVSLTNSTSGDETMGKEVESGTTEHPEPLSPNLAFKS